MRMLRRKAFRIINRRSSSTA
nr:unnamed protein product [Callosobruchus analis]